MKISQKTILFTSLIMLVPILISVAGHIWFDLKTSQKATEQQNLELAVIAANYINNQLDKTEVLLSALETIPEVKQQNAPAVDKILKEIFLKYPFLKAIYAVNLKGEIFAHSSSDKNISEIYRQTIYEQIVTQYNTFISDRVYSLIDEQPIIIITYPIKDDQDTTLGQLAAILPLDRMQDIINIIDTDNDTAIFLIDGQGAVLAASKNSAEKSPDFKGLNAFNDLKINRQGTSKGFNPYTKQLELFSYTTLKNTNWGIVVTQPEEKTWGNLKSDLTHKAFLISLVLFPFVIYIFLTSLRLHMQSKELQTYNKHLEELSYTDNLTNLYNNRYFYQQIELELNRSKRFEKSMTLIILDVDDFKHYNDTNGHLKGDKVLVELALILKSSVRSIDTVARYGGEEFVILLPETDIAAALVVAERIKQSIYGHLFEGKENQPRGILTASMGIAVYPEHALDTTTLIDLADRALYQAKQQKNTIAVASQPLEQLQLNIEG